MFLFTHNAAGLNPYMIMVNVLLPPNLSEQRLFHDRRLLRERHAR